MSWDPIPEKQSIHTLPSYSKHNSEFILTTKTSLNKHTKIELLEEVIRLHSIIREISIELGIVKTSKTGERAVKLHFVSNIVNLIRACWEYNL